MISTVARCACKSRTNGTSGCSRTWNGCSANALFTPWRRDRRPRPEEGSGSGRGTDAVVDCGGPRCLPTPIHPELWSDLRGAQHCDASGDTLRAPYKVFGTVIKPLHNHH